MKTKRKSLSQIPNKKENELIFQINSEPNLYKSDTIDNLNKNKSQTNNMDSSENEVEGGKKSLKIRYK